MFTLDLKHLKFSKVRELKITKVDLRKIEEPLLIHASKERNITFDLSDRNLKLLIAAYDEAGKFLSRTLAIGHKGFEFTQIIYGKNLVIMPFSIKAFRALGKEHRLKIKRTSK